MAAAALVLAAQEPVLFGFTAESGRRQREVERRVPGPPAARALRGATIAS